MGRLNEWVARLKTWFRHEQYETDLQEEIRLHLDLREQRHRAGGLNPDEAHSAALRRFGNTTLLREESREVWGSPGCSSSVRIFATACEPCGAPPVSRPWR